ncbi:MAG: hypothetical protein KDC92_10100 [Bacteroidetes bacterium]|nr:hypothetical protein [Bacteroidota bacterium]
MATLQIRDFPDELHEKLKELAKKDHRSLSQQALILLQDAIEHQERLNTRERVLKRLKSYNRDLSHLPDPVQMVREDRDKYH